MVSQQVLALPHLIQGSGRKTGKKKMPLTVFSIETNCKPFFFIFVLFKQDDNLLDSIWVQGSIQVVETLHPLCGLQVVGNHVLGKNPLHQ